MKSFRVECSRSVIRHRLRQGETGGAGGEGGRTAATLPLWMIVPVGGTSERCVCGGSE